MIILKPHAEIILSLEKEKEIEYDSQHILELEVQGLIDNFVLTPAGELILAAIKKIEPYIGKPETWPPTRSRFIGSEVIYMLKIIKLQRGDVAEEWRKGLEDKGLLYDEEARDLILEAYKIAKPKLSFSPDLIKYILSCQDGPGGKDMLPIADIKPTLLEAMRLIAFSAPRGDVYILTPAGKMVKEALRKRVPVNEIDPSRAKTTFYPPLKISFSEVLILRAIEELWVKHKNDLTILPARNQIEKLVNTKLKSTWHQKFGIHPALFSLEALGLIQSELYDLAYTVYRLTEAGVQVLADQKINEREIHAVSVKALMPADFASKLEWYQSAVKEGLVSQAYPTDSGLMYLKLSQSAVRRPYLQRVDHLALSFIPVNEPIFIHELLDRCNEEARSTGPAPQHRPGVVITKENLAETLDNLEALGAAEVLGNGAVMLTPAGKTLKKAACISTNRETPLTPHMVKILEAASKIGQKWGKKIEVFEWKKVEKKIGLDAETFHDALILLNEGKYIEANFITELGLLLLEASQALGAARIN